MKSLRILLGAALLLALASAGCRSSLPDQQPVQTQPLGFQSDEWRVTDNVVVITDASGTQYVNETFPEAKALTRSFVAAMPEANAPSASGRGYQAGLIGFGGDERIKAPVGSFDRGNLSSTAAGLDVMGDVSGTGGTTPLHTVIWESQNALEGKPGRAALVIFSDGLPDDPPVAVYSAQQLVNARNGNVCIHTVQTGDEPEGADFLKSLSGLTPCGSFRSSDQISSGAEVQQLARVVFLGPSSLPPVAAGNPCETAVRLQGIEFAFDRAEVTSSSRPVLDVAVQQLGRCPEVRVTVTGHTDSVGAETYNQKLSYDRAKATRDYLVKSGIPAGRLEVEGLGEAKPVATNDSAEGRGRNRRVELAPLR